MPPSGGDRVDAMEWRDREVTEGMPAAEQPDGKRDLIVSRLWVQVALLVFVVGFFVLVYLGYRTYQDDPPIAERAVDPNGQVVFTGADVDEGQKVFLRHGLMEYGSIFGHGAYLGPDFTADYLHRSSESVRDQLGGGGSDSARQETIEQFQTNRYEP
jgi:nitric oxide reductase subunit B